MTVHVHKSELASGRMKNLRFRWEAGISRVNTSRGKRCAWVTGQDNYRAIACRSIFVHTCQVKYSFFSF